ncbi:hypothetical protein HK102_013439 [Quaeritorhiza haematococci]|nr:hypothetical protein HK102_013439 [Quaeritorhiza haematococci]
MSTTTTTPTTTGLSPSPPPGADLSQQPITLVNVIANIFASTKFAPNFVLLSQFCFIGWAMVSCRKHCRGAFWNVLLLVSTISFIAGLLNAVQNAFAFNPNPNLKMAHGILGIIVEPLYAFTEFGVAVATYVRINDRVKAATQSRRYQQYLFLTFGTPLFLLFSGYTFLRVGAAIRRFRGEILDDTGRRLTAPTVGCEGPWQCGIIGITYLIATVPVLAILYREMRECRRVLKLSITKSIFYPLGTSTFAALMTVTLTYAYLALSVLNANLKDDTSLLIQLQTPSVLFKAFFPFILAFDDMIQKLVRAPTAAETLLLQNAAAAASAANAPGANGVMTMKRLSSNPEKQRPASIVVPVDGKEEMDGTEKRKTRRSLVISVPPFQDRRVTQANIVAPTATAANTDKPAIFVSSDSDSEKTVTAVSDAVDQKPEQPTENSLSFNDNGYLSASFASGRAPSYISPDSHQSRLHVPGAFPGAADYSYSNSWGTGGRPGPGLSPPGAGSVDSSYPQAGLLGRTLDAHLFAVSRFSEQVDPSSVRSSRVSQYFLAQSPRSYGSSLSARVVGV